MVSTSVHQERVSKRNGGLPCRTSLIRRHRVHLVSEHRGKVMPYVVVRVLNVTSGQQRRQGYGWLCDFVAFRNSSLVSAEFDDGRYGACSLSVGRSEVAANGSVSLHQTVSVALFCGRSMLLMRTFTTSICVRFRRSANRAGRCKEPSNSRLSYSNA